MPVRFHTGLPDVLAAAQARAAAAQRAGQRLWLVGPAPLLAGLSRALWLEPPLAFVPHLRVADAPFAAGVAQRTLIWLGEGAWAAPQPAEAVVCVGGDALSDAAQAHAAAGGQVIELVGSDALLAQAGRRRWQAWRSAGLEPVHAPAE